MDWFAEADYAAGQFLRDIFDKKVTEEQVRNNPVVAQNYVSITNGSYTQLNPSNQQQSTNGWKFHISVDPVQIKEAFNHIAPDLMKEGITFKVGTERTHADFGDESNPQKGKAIVIYAEDGKDMGPILKRVEQKLAEAGIQPGTSVNNDKKLGNSSYMYYRNDLDHSESYVSSSRVNNLPEDRKFNPFNKPDPYQNIHFSTSTSPVRPPPEAPAVQGAKILLETDIIEGMKGNTKVNYLGVNSTADEFRNLQKALKQQGFQEGKHYQIKPSSINNGNPVISISADGMTKLEEIKTSPVANPVTSQPPQNDNRKVLAEAPSIPTDKGTYIGIGSSPAEIDDFKKRLTAEGFKENIDFRVKPSSLNNGNNIIAFSATGHERLEALKTEHAAQVTKPATATTPPSTAPATPVTATAEPAKPSAAKADINLPEPSKSAGAHQVPVNAIGSKVDSHAGKAQLAVEVAAEVAKGNYVGAATTAAVAIAEQQGIKFVAKRIPVVGGLITAGMTLWSAGSQAAQGNWKKAGSELTAGAAETAGNVVGFGLGDAAREAARKGMLIAGVKEENAPDKSGLRVAAETAFDMAKTIKNAAQLKTMSKAELAQAIQKDPVLPDNVNLKGKQVTLAQAMEDKVFRTAMIKNIETMAQKNPEFGVRVAALKEYGARLDAADAVKPQVTAIKPAATAAQPAATTTASAAKPTPNAVPSSATVVAEAQYKSMSITQLASTIQKDPKLADTVKVGNKEVQLSEALKDKDFRKDYLTKLEKVDAAGTDMDKQIAMVKAYETALERPQQVAPATKAPQQSPHAAAPSMA